MRGTPGPCSLVSTTGFYSSQERKWKQSPSTPQLYSYPVLFWQDCCQHLSAAWASSMGSCLSAKVSLHFATDTTREKGRHDTHQIAPDVLQLSCSQQRQSWSPDWLESLDSWAGGDLSSEIIPSQGKYRDQCSCVLSCSAMVWVVLHKLMLDEWLVRSRKG